MTKEELIQRLQDSREATLNILNSLDEEDFATVLPNSEWTVKDMLFHCTMWEAELIKLLWQLQAGQKPTTVHFGRQSIDEANQNWYLLGKDRDLDQIFDDFSGTREQTVRRLGQFTDEDLAKIISFPFGEQTLFERIANDSYAHEEEHIEELKKLFDIEG